MNEEKYQVFLKTAPQDHFSNEFLQFLRNNNKIVEEKDNWLIIQNCKDPNDYTAFHKDEDNFLAYSRLNELVGNYFGREWRIKAPHKRSIMRFHVHLIQK